MTRNEQQFTVALAHAFKTPQERLDVSLASVEFLRDAKLIPNFVVAKRKGAYLTVLGQLVLTVFQVHFEAIGRLIAIFGIFRHEFQNDRRDGWRDGAGLTSLMGRHWRFGNVTMNECHDIVTRKRQLAREQFVKGDTQGVEITAIIDRTVDAPGLLGGEIGQGASEAMGAGERLRFSR